MPVKPAIRQAAGDSGREFTVQLIVSRGARRQGLKVNQPAIGCQRVDHPGEPVVVHRFVAAIETVNVGFAAYFEELGRVGLVAENKDKTMVGISGTKMRELLNAGEMPDDRVMRPSTAEVLVQYYAQKG